jgi:transposase
MRRMKRCGIWFAPERSRKRDQLRARQRLGKFLLRHGHQRPATLKTTWTRGHIEWIKTAVHFDQPAQDVVLGDYVAEVEHVAARIARLDHAIADAAHTAPPRMRAVIAALQALRGVAEVAAVTIVAEVGDLSRFQRAPQLMGYSGLVPSEYTSGERRRTGSITKTGNAHLRRVVVEAAWAYRWRPAVRHELRKRHVGLSPGVLEIAWKAQHRLHRRFQRFLARGKNQPQIVTAIARELLGFIWAIGVMVETDTRDTGQAA